MLNDRKIMISEALQKRLLVQVNLIGETFESKPTVIPFIIPRHYGQSSITTRSYLQVGQFILRPNDVMVNVSSREIYYELVALLGGDLADQLMLDHSYPFMPYELFDSNYVGSYEGQIDIEATINNYLVEIVGVRNVNLTELPVLKMLPSKHEDTNRLTIRYNSCYRFSLSENYRERMRSIEGFESPLYIGDGNSYMLKDTDIYHHLLEMEYSKHEQ